MPDFVLSEYMGDYLLCKGVVERAMRDAVGFVGTKDGLDPRPIIEDARDFIFGLTPHRRMWFRFFCIAGGKDSRDVSSRVRRAILKEDVLKGVLEDTL